MIIYNSSIVGAAATTGSLGDSWSAWDEAAESTLAIDQNGDGVDDTFVCFYEGASDETGRGVVTGADLKLTQGGVVPAAGGAPPRRLLDGSAGGMTFAPTSTLIDTFFLAPSNTYTFVAKMYIKAGASRNYYGFTLTGAVPSMWIGFYPKSSDGSSTFYLTDTDSNETLVPANVTPLDQVVYVFVYSNGTKTRVGVTTAKPTSWAAIAAGDKTEATALFDNFTTFNDTSYIASGNTTGIYHYYSILSKLALIGA